MTACYNYNPAPPTTKLPTSDCKPIKHSLGDSCIPREPKRLIVTDRILLEAAIALGVKPIAAAEPNLVGSQGQQFTGKIEGIVSIGKESLLNLERIVKLQPDLIVGAGIYAENYNILSQIAPTVPFDYLPSTWRDNLLYMGELLGKTERAEQILAQYQERVEKLQTAIEQKRKSIEVSVSRFYAAGQPDFQTQYSFSGSVLADVGLTKPAVQRRLAGSAEQLVVVSLERLDLLDADVMFVALDPGAEESFQKYQKSQLWQLLDVVKKNRVFTVDSGYWIFGNVLSANAILDDLNRYLLAQE